MGLSGTQISVGLQYLNELMFVWGAVQRKMKLVVKATTNTLSIKGAVSGVSVH